MLPKHTRRKGQPRHKYQDGKVTILARGRSRSRFVQKPQGRSGRPTRLFVDPESMDPGDKLRGPVAS